MLHNIGITINSQILVISFNPDRYETNVKNVFWIGVIAKGITNNVCIEDGRFYGFKITKSL